MQDKQHPFLPMEIMLVPDTYSLCMESNRKALPVPKTSRPFACLRGCGFTCMSQYGLAVLTDMS